MLPRRSMHQQTAFLSPGPTKKSSSFQQYHSALLLLIDIHTFPHQKEADRIWSCLDWVFEIPHHIPKDQKSRWVITEVRDKMGIYISSRKVLAPASMPDRIGGQPSRSPSHSSSSPTPSVGKLRQTSGDFTQGYTQASTAYQQNSEAFKPDAALFSAAQSQYTIPIAGPSIQNEKIIDIDWVCCSDLVHL